MTRVLLMSALVCLSMIIAKQQSRVASASCRYITESGKVKTAKLNQSYSDGCNNCRCTRTGSKCSSRACPNMCKYTHWSGVIGYGKGGGKKRLNVLDKNCRKKCKCVKGPKKAFLRCLKRCYRKGRKKREVIQTVLPTGSPSMLPTTLRPTSVPTISPSLKPSPIPSYNPSPSPEVRPSATPTFSPTFVPTTSILSGAPSFNPSPSPTAMPSITPTFSPTFVPTSSIRSGSPSLNPSPSPTAMPSATPTFSPTFVPTTSIPSGSPSLSPTPSPSLMPTTSIPSGSPSLSPTPSPSVTPTTPNPVSLPTQNPTRPPEVRLTGPQKTKYENNLDGRLNWQAGTNRMITGIYSEHDNGKEDRRFGFYSKAASGFSCSPTKTFPHSKFDEEFKFQCSKNEAMYGVFSYHDDGTEDRRFAFRCCLLSSSAVLEPLGWTAWANKFDEKLDFQCRDGHVLIGVHSKHSNNKQDRRFSFQCAQLSNRMKAPTPNLPSLTRLQTTSYINYWDETFKWAAGSNRLITGIYSEHIEEKNDRLFGFYSKAASGFSCLPNKASPFVNDFDKEFKFKCSENEAIYSIYSVHDDGKEDRRFAFTCCRLSSPVILKTLYWTAWVNKYDEEFDFQCREGDVLTGVHSKHSDGKEDRIFSFQCSRLDHKLQ